MIGFTAVTAQVVLMRELLVLFSGTETTLGFALAGWLLWTALGSGLAGRLGARLAALEALIALALPLTILGARAAKSVLAPVPGEMLAPGVVLIVSFVALGPFCVLSGWLFAAGSRLYGTLKAASSVKATGTVYLLEAAGSAGGGILASVFLIRYLDALQIAFLLSFLNLAAAASLTIRAPLARRAAVVLLLAVCPLTLTFAAPRINAASLARLWRGFQLIDARDSVYGSLVVAGREGSATLYENGLPLVTAPDPEEAEEAVHYALLEHPAPQSLLLIGGGVNGSLAEALKHPSLKRADYVELDPAILDLAAKHFAPAWPATLADARVRVHRMDGRLFLKTTADSFDVIIVNLPEPQTAQINRFYTLEFFREAAAKLRPGGVFSFRLTSSENYISPELAALLRSIRKTLGAVFSEVAFIPGETLHLFASNSRGTLVSTADGILERLRRRGIQTTYVREYYLPFRMAPDRMADLAAKIAPTPGTPLNRDATPVAYYFDAVLWSTRFGSGSSLWLKRLGEASFGGVLGATALTALVLALLARRRPAGVAGLAAAAMGFAMIGLQLLLLLGFQAVHGYVYHQLALLIAMFMAGMALGSWTELHRNDEARAHDSRRLAALQALAAIAPILPVWLLETHAAPALFSAAALLSGFLGGCQFPLASRIYFSGAGGRQPGTLYALDLAGSCLGALLFSAWVVPLFGFGSAALLISVVCLASALPPLLKTQSR